MGVDVAQLFRDAEGEPDGLPGAHRTEGLFEIGVETVEQTRQMGSSFLEKKPRAAMPRGFGFNFGVKITSQRKHARYHGRSPGQHGRR